jgi:type I restriction enzyme S subunit
MKNNWQKVKLGDLITIYNGKAHQSLTEKGNFPVFGSGGLMGYTHDFMYNGEAILLPRKGTLTNIQYLNEKFWVVDTTYYVVVNKEKADTKFLCNYLKMISNHLTNLDSGSAVPSMTQKAYQEIPLFLPPLAVQQGIARVLSLLDEKIELNRKISRESFALAQTLYNYTFLQNKNPNWNVEKLGDIATIRTGKEDANFATENGEHNFYTCAIEPLKCDTPVFEGKSVLIAGNGNFNVKFCDEKFNAYQRTYVVQPKEDGFWEMIYFAVKNTIQKFVQGSNGSIIKFITLGDVQNVELPIPNPTTLAVFQSSVRPLFAQILACRQQSAELARLRDYLLPLLMSGNASVCYQPPSPKEKGDITMNIAIKHE